MDTNLWRILSWNIRGLNSEVHRRDLKVLRSKWLPNIICLQETKMSKISGTDISSFWSTNEVKAIYQEARGLSGGLLICWNDEKIALKDYWNLEYSLAALFKDRTTGR